MIRQTKSVGYYVEADSGQIVSASYWGGLNAQGVTEIALTILMRGEGEHILSRTDTYWDKLTSGQVIDVEYLLNESETPKLSESVDPMDAKRGLSPTV